MKQQPFGPFFQADLRRAATTYLVRSKRFRAYDETSKSWWVQSACVMLRPICTELREPLRQVRVNRGGIAVSGEVTLSLPHWGIYLCATVLGGQLSPLYARGCDEQDPYGSGLEYSNWWPRKTPAAFASDLSAWLRNRHALAAARHEAARQAGQHEIAKD